MMQCATEHTVGQQRLSPQHAVNASPPRPPPDCQRKSRRLVTGDALSLMERRIVHAQGKIERIRPLLQQLYHRFAHALADEVVGFGVVVPVIALTAG